jgi:hypothetical protein
MRVATHERNRASLHEINTRWTMSNLIDAHLALDVHDELADRAVQEARRQQQSRR